MIYSTIGIIVARLLFGANSGIVSVIFTSLLLLPYLKKLLRGEEEKEEKEKSFKLKKLFKDNWEAIKVYGMMFIGIYLAYTFYSFVLPLFGFEASIVFKEQLLLDPALKGNAVFMSNTFISILINNWWVLLACFLLALLTGDGAVFFVTWNASSWGAIFGYRTLAAGMYSGTSIVYNLVAVLLITLPHVLLEGGAYILSAISGGVINDEIIEKKEELIEFLIYAFLAVTVYVMVAVMLNLIIASKTVFTIINAVLILALIYCIKFLFDKKKYKEVFTYNYVLFLTALVIFIIGAVIETLVIGNSETLNRIYSFAGMFAG